MTKVRTFVTKSFYGPLLVTKVGEEGPRNPKSHAPSPHESGYWNMAPCLGPRFPEEKYPGSDLLSHPVARAVPSAVEGLTAGFGMGPGVSPLLWPPERYSVVKAEGPRKLIASVSNDQGVGQLV